jgi:hypothetical protein
MRQPLFIYIVIAMKTKVFLVFLALFAFNCHKDNPFEGEYEPVAFKGTVVDSSGNTISGVGVHYIFNMYTKRVLNTGNTEPSTVIKFTIPDSGYVRMKIMRWYSRDSIDTVVDGPYSAGTYSVDISSLKLTNGVYIYQVTTASTFTERTFLIDNEQVSELIAKTPLTLSGSDGKFSIPLGVFGINMPVVSATSDTTYISNTIEMVLYKNGYKTLTKQLSIDLTKENAQSFVLEKE